MRTENAVTSPDSRKWASTQRGFGKYTRAVKTFDTKREHAVIMSRIYIQRTDLLASDLPEQCYLATLCGYISKFDFNADILRVTQTRFAKVLAEGKKLTDKAS